MTTIEGPQQLAAEPEPIVATIVSRWERFEALLMRAGDHLNPILVKEARQALRSRQFLITFFLMLTAGWVWSILGLASIGPAVYFAAEGPQMLFVYHLFLSVPLLLVAPYTAFHSLSSERQDRTYELVSITALGARQILTGKLCAIGLQMIVYLSAIFPCLAFTYLLRGLDIFTIVMVVVYTCGLSIALSVIGLFLGAIAPLRQRHIAMSVLFAVGLFGALWIDNLWTYQIVYFGGMRVESSEFWLVQCILLTIFLNVCVIAFLAARSQLLTVSENRSTALRWSLVVAQLSFVAWIAWAQMSWSDNEIIFGLIYFSTVAWYVAGMFLTSESAALSPRVKRDLPQSLLGRTFLTWFRPGPGTGYIFVICSMVTVAVFALLPYWWLANLFRDLTVSTSPVGLAVGTVAIAPPARPLPNSWELLIAGIVAISYIVFYLGLGSLIVRGLRRYTEVKLALPVLVNLCLILFGSLTPWVIQMTSPTMRELDWTLVQIPNAIWTLSDICFDDMPQDVPVLLTALPAVALIVFLLNLPALLDELGHVRAAKPARVEEEDAEEAARRAGALEPVDPWDERPSRLDSQS
ncbi:MAG: ABC transporter permease [Pirellulales bacterium]